MNQRVIFGGILAIPALFATQISAFTFADNTTDFSITVNPSLSLRVSSSNVGFNITPNKDGEYNSASFNVYSSTNNSTGYTLTMSTNNVNLKSNTVNVNTGTEPIIPTLTETNDGITAAAFEASTDSSILNHYGVSIAGANFNAMKAEKEIKVTDENNTTEDTTVIALASKLDLNTVPGIYSTTINFQLVANSTDPVQPYPEDPCDSNPNCDSTSGTTLQRAYEMAYTSAHKGMYEETTAGSNVFQYIDSWNGVQYQGQGRDVRFLIQDMTPEICSTATAINSEARVLDIRDGKSYWIAKLADGRCWMTQNLDLNLVANQELNSTTSDLNTWNGTGYGANGGYRTNNGIIYWSPVRSTILPSEISNTGYMADYQHDNRTPYSVDSGNWYYSGVYKQDVNNYLDTVNNGAGDQFSTTMYPLNKEHGHVGNHYNWSAAIASNNSSDLYETTFEITSHNPKNSICPKGWRLPIAAADSDTDELAKLFSYLVETPSQLNTMLAGAPFYRVTSGAVFYNSLQSPGTAGDYWTSTIWSSEKAYFVGIGNDYNNKLDGHSVRCIARTGTEPNSSGN